MSAASQGDLAQRLDRIRAGFAENAPPEALAIMERAKQGLRDSGILDRLPRVGATLPSFALPDTSGAIVRSEDLLARGPLVISLYRGVW